MNLTHALAALTLALRLHAGDHIVEHGDTVDRIQWILPRARLEAAQRSGAVIDEEFRTTSRADEKVLAAFGDHALIHGVVDLVTLDVPRGKTARSASAQTVDLTTFNAVLGDPRYDIADAPMIGLPKSAIRLGTRWTTRVRVVTALGSGSAGFTHRIVDIGTDLVRIEVTGTGTITGKEYNLPKLLPGTIAVRGSAWYSLTQGIIVRESYRIDNALVKPAGPEQIGFKEVLFIDSDAHKAGRSTL